MMDLAWAAGLVEGEGCPCGYIFSDQKNGTRKYVRLSLSTTDLDIAERYAAWLDIILPPGQGTHERPIRVKNLAMDAKRRKFPNCKQQYIVRVSGRRAMLLMVLLRPYLGQRRREQIDKALVLSGAATILE